jgi:hypothetical protein
VERKNYVSALEILLRVEVRRVGDDPPATLRAVNVPDVIANRADDLRRRTLDLNHLLIGLLLDVTRDVPAS